ncbi:uncharacterized protein LOC111637891 [Centruroides sculpturatus]|uniref:uncharacterized protein LOC111637891 n=1 Tax=Centruroides sculpturatus TaxID=218467 RepID=UPI000C6EE71C|nr:uncharacterized protein LOC111637891 [Centruroides sculpturatus]
MNFESKDKFDKDAPFSIKKEPVWDNDIEIKQELEFEEVCRNIKAECDDWNMVKVEQDIQVQDYKIESQFNLDFLEGIESEPSNLQNGPKIPEITSDYEFSSIKTDGNLNLQNPAEIGTLIGQKHSDDSCSFDMKTFSQPDENSALLFCTKGNSSASEEILPDTELIDSIVKEENNKGRSPAKMIMRQGQTAATVSFSNIQKQLQALLWSLLVTCQWYDKRQICMHSDHYMSCH